MYLNCSSNEEEFERSAPMDLRNPVAQTVTKLKVLLHFFINYKRCMGEILASFQSILTHFFNIAVRTLPHYIEVRLLFYFRGRHRSGEPLNARNLEISSEVHTFFCDSGRPLLIAAVQKYWTRFCKMSEISGNGSSISFVQLYHLDSSIHSLILWFIDSYNHSCIRSFIHSLVQSTYQHIFIHSSIHSCIHSFIRCSILPWFVLFIFIYSFTHSFTYSFICAFIHSFLHAFIHLFTIPFLSPTLA